MSVFDYRSWGSINGILNADLTLHHGAQRTSEGSHLNCHYSPWLALCLVGPDCLESEPVWIAACCVVVWKPNGWVSVSWHWPPTWIHNNVKQWIGSDGPEGKHLKPTQLCPSKSCLHCSGSLSVITYGKIWPYMTWVMLLVWLLLWKLASLI